MPSPAQYLHILKTIFDHAQLIATAVSTSAKEDTLVAAECRSVLKFLRDWGCLGFPFHEESEFSIGPWLQRPGTPANQDEAVTIIPCFSEDTKIGLPEHWHNDTVPGLLIPQCNVIALYDVDRWSFGELALTLFHEGRHARHRLGPALANLSPLDPEETHETNTWMFIIGILQQWGKEEWRCAVEKEVDWLTEKNYDHEPNRIAFDMSGERWTELHSLFGVPQNPEKLKFRQRLVALEANATYWHRRIPSLSPEQVAHSIVTHCYKQ